MTSCSCYSKAIPRNLIVIRALKRSIEEDPRTVSSRAEGKTAVLLKEWSISSTIPTILVPGGQNRAAAVAIIVDFPPVRPCTSAPTVPTPRFATPALVHRRSSCSATACWSLASVAIFYGCSGCHV